MAPDTRPKRETRPDATQPATSAGSHDTVGLTTTSSGPSNDTASISQSQPVARVSYLRTKREARREARRDATDPATSAGSHDTVGCTTTSFGPPKETTTASAWSDHSVSGLSYISPANVGFDPTAPIDAVPYERPKAPTPGSIISPSLQPMPFNDRVLFSDLLPSDPPSSCDFGTLKNFGAPKKFAHTPVFGPSPPYVPKTRGRAKFQARCETASPSTDIWTRFCRDFTTPDLCAAPTTAEGAAPTTTTAEDAAPNEPREAAPTAPTEVAAPPTPTTIPEKAAPTTPEAAEDTIEQAHVDAFTNWSLYALPGNLLADFVSGVLQFSRLDDDGNPLFTKNTDTKTSPQQQSPNNHKDVNAVHVPEEETQMFVSMDQLRREIAQLQEHDEAMEREADKAHQEKARLELQLQEVRGTCRKSSSDSAIGSDSDEDIRRRTQAEKLKRMQKRLDEANNLANSQHVHIDALTAERDELIKECHLAHEHKKLLTEKNQLLTEQNKVLNKENQELKYQIENAGQYFMSIENEVKHFKSENERLRQQLSQLHQQNDSLRKTRKSHSEQIKNLQSELDATREQFTQDCEQLTQDREQLAQDREQLTQDITVLVNKNKEVKKQRDNFEYAWENLQDNYLVLRRQLCAESTTDSINSSTNSTGTVVRHRKTPSIQIRRISPQASPDNSVNEEHTMRPVQDKYTNMQFLISTTEKELVALEQKLLQKTIECNNIHKGYNRRKWEELHKQKVSIEEAVQEKSNIVYHQYDLLEGIKRDTMTRKT